MATEVKEMMSLIKESKPGDKIKIVFAEKTFGEDLKGRIYHILMMCAPVGNAIDIGELPTSNLKAVADSGKWYGFSTYFATILDEFDPDYFIHQMIGQEMLKSIEKI